MARTRKAKQLPTTSRTASSGISSTVMEGPPCGEGRRGRSHRSSIGEVLGNADLTDSTRISVTGVTVQLLKHSSDQRVSKSKNLFEDSIIVAFSPSSSGWFHVHHQCGRRGPRSVARLHCCLCRHKSRLPTGVTPQSVCPSHPAVCQGNPVSALWPATVKKLIKSTSVSTPSSLKMVTKV